MTTIPIYTPADMRDIAMPEPGDALTAKQRRAMRAVVQLSRERGGASDQCAFLGNLIVVASCVGHTPVLTVETLDNFISTCEDA